MAHRSLDQLDRKILRLIAEDARIPFLEVARECKVSGAPTNSETNKFRYPQRFTIHNRS